MSIEVISGSEKLTGEKIRYINYGGEKYFIYSLKEHDEDGYEKLYMNKITNGEEDIISDLDWEELKKVIPSIVKQIKTNNIFDFEDLEISEVERINLNYSKPFKLKIDIVKSIKKEEVKIEKMEEELQELISGISKQANDSVDDLDAFLNNYEEELNKYEEELNKVEVPIRPDIEQTNIQDINEIDKLKELLEQEINNKEELSRKVEELESELNRYKDKLERIKIMLEA
ncbi:MAG: hypothetical protein E7157_00920 [Lactobacillales bacterium]|nr:hypothetical protein [Lactobacillales bacterium]